MNYQKIYDQLIDRAKSRTLSGYYESHHIIPKCTGGLDIPDNLVNLTASEHFLAHQLLAKIHKHNTKLIFAANMMTVDKTGNRINNKQFEWIRKNWIEALKIEATGRKASEETKAKQREKASGKNNPMYGLRGNLHPSYKTAAWDNQRSTPYKSEWKYAGQFYDWYMADLKLGKYKRQGHKRMLMELNLTCYSNAPRQCLKKFKQGWNPYTDQDWLNYVNT